MTSEPMQITRETLPLSSALQSRVGAIKEVRLKKLWGYENQPGYGNSSARLAVVAVGEKGSLSIDLVLSQVNDRWVIVESSTPL